MSSFIKDFSYKYSAFSAKFYENRTALAKSASKEAII